MAFVEGKPVSKPRVRAFTLILFGLLPGIDRPGLALAEDIGSEGAAGWHPSLFQESAYDADLLALPGNDVRHQAGYRVPAVPPLVTRLLASPESAFAIAETLARPGAGLRPANPIRPRALLAALRRLEATLPAPPNGAARDSWRQAMTTAPDPAAAPLRFPPGWSELAPGRLLALVERVTGAIGHAADPADLAPLTAGWPRHWGPVVIGSAAADHHDFQGGLLIDPGGDDTYSLADPVPGGVALIIDLAGDDRYRGAATAAFGIAVTIDHRGNDTYLPARESTGATGPAAALGGLALLVDLAGDDDYRGGRFALAAAVMGVAQLIDLKGDDRYHVTARGQGFAGPRGLAMLADFAGDDNYIAGGLADPYHRRGGGLSYAQGVGLGRRGDAGGGIGILHDRAGDDNFDAEMIAQGAASFLGLGVLHDQGGDDRYRAARYGQGQASHGAIGVLHDRAGDDDYVLSVGVGQGMGLDAAIGILRDDQGDDAYRAGDLAQGASRGVGAGILVDRQGDDRYALAAPGDGWGRGRPSRLLPVPAWRIDHHGSDSVRLSDRPLPEPASGWPAGGPFHGQDRALPPPPRPACPQPSPDAAPFDTALLARAAPLLGSGPQARAAFTALIRALPERLDILLQTLPTGRIGLTANLRRIVECYLATADDRGRKAVRERLLAALEAGAPHDLLIAGLLRRTRPDPGTAGHWAARFARHPNCALRAEARYLIVAAGKRRMPRHAWPSGLDDPCRQVQAAALYHIAWLQGRRRARLSLARSGALPASLRPLVEIGRAGPEFAG